MAVPASRAPRRNKPWTPPAYIAESVVGDFRFQARCAYLDGRVARSKELHRRADVVARLLQRREASR